MVSKEVESFCCGKDGTPLELPEAVALQISKLGGLGKLIKRLPKESMLKDVARRHQALSDPVRFRLLWALSMADLCPCILKQIAEVSDSKLSYHLNVLEGAGLVSSKRTKNWMIYTITKEGAGFLSEGLRVIKKSRELMDDLVRFSDDNLEKRISGKRKGTVDR